LASVREALVGSTLDDRFNHERFGETSLRWVYNHMIAEYARHIGHAVLLRERIDGVTGE
jgi:predicted acetyltransferase